MQEQTRTQEVSMWDRWVLAGWVIFYLIVVPLGKFWRLWVVRSPQQLFMNGDVYHEYWPDLHLYLEAVRKGDWPLYNPFMNFGFPIVSDPQNGVYYPFSWVYLAAGALFDRVTAFYFFEWVTLVPVGLLGLGMHLYLRQMGLSHGAALLGGLASMSSGFVNRAYYLKFMQSFAWTPWAMLALERLILRADLRRALALGAVCGLAVLAGGPPGVFYLVLWVAAYFVFRVVQEQRSRGWWGILSPLMRWLPLSVMVAVGLSAVVMLPFFDIAGTTVRSNVGYNFMADTYLHYLHTLGFFLPGYEPQFYHGWLVLLLSLGAVILARRWRGLVVFCVVASILGVLLSMGPYTFAIDLLYLWVPGSSTFRRSVRYHYLLGLALPILSALGFELLRRRAASQLSERYLWIVRFVVFLGIGVALATAWWGEIYTATIAAWRPLLHVAFVLSMGGALLHLIAKAPHAKLWFVFFLAVYTFDLYAYHPMYDTSPHWQFVGWRSPMLQRQPRGTMAAYRTMNDIEDGSRNASNVYLVRDAMNYWHPLLSRRFYDVIPAIQRDPDLLRFFNVKNYLACLPGNDHYRWCLASHGRFSSRWQKEERVGTIQQYRLKDPIPRVLWLPHVIQVNQKSEILGVMAKQDPWKVAVLDRDDFPVVSGLSPLPWPPLAMGGALSLRPYRLGARLAFPTTRRAATRPQEARGIAGVVRKASFNVIEAEIHAPRSGIVLVNEVYYKHWRATLNGKPIPVGRANFMMIGVRVPAGKHLLRLEYRPRSFFVGSFLSLLTALLCLLVWLFIRPKGSENYIPPRFQATRP